MPEIPRDWLRGNIATQRITSASLANYGIESQEFASEQAFEYSDAGNVRDGCHCPDCEASRTEQQQEIAREQEMPRIETNDSVARISSPEIFRRVSRGDSGSDIGYLVQTSSSSYIREVAEDYVSSDYQGRALTGTSARFAGSEMRVLMSRCGVQVDESLDQILGMAAVHAALPFVAQTQRARADVQRMENDARSINQRNQRSAERFATELTAMREQFEQLEELKAAALAWQDAEEAPAKFEAFQRLLDAAGVVRPFEEPTTPVYEQMNVDLVSAMTPTD